MESERGHGMRVEDQKRKESGQALSIMVGRHVGCDSDYFALQISATRIFGISIFAM